jgi:hypothetical protein
VSRAENASIVVAALPEHVQVADRAADRLSPAHFRILVATAAAAEEGETAVSDLKQEKARSWTCYWTSCQSCRGSPGQAAEPAMILASPSQMDENWHTPIPVSTLYSHQMENQRTRC